jgi:hypothetical protein
MWYWNGGFWWPGFVLMAVFMVICMLMMVRMMSSTGGTRMCGFGHWFQPRETAEDQQRIAGEQAPRRDSDRSA